MLKYLFLFYHQLYLPWPWDVLETFKIKKAKYVLKYAPKNKRRRHVNQLWKHWLKLLLVQRPTIVDAENFNTET